MAETPDELGVETLTDGYRHFSVDHPDRCVVELLFGGWAMYLKEGENGTRVGIAPSQSDAARWLDGEPLSEIEHYTVAE